MPSFFPEANTTIPSDSELRSLAKYCQMLYDLHPAVSSPFPEGNRPLPSDDEERLYQKITILQNA